MRGASYRAWSMSGQANIPARLPLLPTFKNSSVISRKWPANSSFHYQLQPQLQFLLMPHPPLRQRRHKTRMMLRPKPPILLLNPQPRRLLRFSRLQPQPLSLEQLTEHSHSVLARRQSPAQLSVERAGDLADFVGVGRVSSSRLQIPFEKV